MSTKLFQLEGEEFETAFLSECTFFINAEGGVQADQIMAGMILRDAGKFDMLQLLHERKIRVLGSVEEDAELEDLEFQVV